jgi:hypothetical protein
MDLSKLSTARKLELMKSFVRERPKTSIKQNPFHPSARKKQTFMLMNPHMS